MGALYRLASTIKKSVQFLACEHGQACFEFLPARAALDLAVWPDIDILAHPGLITPEEAVLAAERGILLEISGRKGHSFANGHVVRVAQAAGAGMVLNSDAHEPGDLLSKEMIEKIALGAGIEKTAIRQMVQNAETLARRQPK